jgi:hypothetical protein
MKRNILIAAALFLLCAQSFSVAGWQVVEERSVLAVVTYKANIGALLAHDHLITASNYSLDIAFDETAPVDTTMSFEVAAENLVFDDPGIHDMWSARMIELQIVEQAFEDIEDGKRQKFRDAMLGKKQLRADTFPTIAARIVKVGRFASTIGSQQFDYFVLLELDLRGKSVTKPLKARFVYDGKNLEVEALGSFKFSDFGIKPYTAMLGAVRNRDKFTVYAKLVLEPVED